MQHAVISPWSGEITPDLIPDLDDLCIANVRMPESRLRGRVRESFDRTRERALADITCRAVLRGYPVKRVDGSGVVLENGTEIADAALAEALAGSVEVVAFTVSSQGFEALTSADGCSSIDAMFYNGWGVAFSAGGQRYLEDMVRERAHAAGLYTGKSWSPGYEDMSMELQEPLYRLSQARSIGVELRDSGMMKPVMSVGGFIGVFEDGSAEEQETVLMV